MLLALELVFWVLQPPVRVHFTFPVQGHGAEGTCDIVLGILMNILYVITRAIWRTKPLSAFATMMVK